MKINEAKEILKKNGFLVERSYSETTRYGNRTGAAGYTYKSPTKDRMYIKILQQLLDGPKTKAEVHLAIGLPDPTIKNDRGQANNYYTSVWQEMRRAGLVDFEREDGTVKWYITPRGMKLIDEANGVDTDGV